ncbi:MAG: hypothetical protein K6G31_12845 [Paludibacteraceae bacterium]|nr:hypothetical protein [Paludibacteraceae bacterium]MCR5570136.1 hypothetical protein [Paludibacteraceae bacterium]
MNKKLKVINDKNRLVILLLIVFKSFCCYGENWNMVTFSPITYNDTSAIDDFLRGDSSSFRKIDRITSTRIKCFYESEFFMYSLVMALQFDDASAFTQLTNSINRFYCKNNLEKGVFANKLISIFQTKCKDVLDDDILENFCPRLFNYSSLQINYKRKLLRNDTLKSVLYEGNEYLYTNQLYNLLKNNCGRFNREDPFTFFYSGPHMIFYSMYYADKYNHAEGLFNIFLSIYRFIEGKGVIPNRKLTKFAKYFLKQSYELKYSEAIDFVDN